MSRRTTTTLSSFSFTSSIDDDVKEERRFESMRTTQRGRIDLLFISKDKQSLEIKLNKRRETLELELCNDENWLNYPQGKGPIIKLQTNRTQDLGQIFRDKETLAELEDKKSQERIEPNLERVQSIKKKLQNNIKKSGLPLTLGLRDIEGTFGHLVTKQNGNIIFTPAADQSNIISINQEDDESIMSGEWIQEQNRFVPGTILANQFLPGIETTTTKGRQFIAGQILNTKKGQKFFPGQYYGNEFVPGQIIKQLDGESRFIPGQIIETFGFGPTFIPGQIMRLNDHDSFVAGEVIEVCGNPHFVPGKVIEENGRIKFESGELIETDEGLKWIQFQLQSWDIDEEIDSNIQPSSSQSHLSTSLITNTSPPPPPPPPLESSNLIQSLILAGVEIGESIQIPSVEIELSQTTIDNYPHLLKRSLSINTFSLFNHVLHSMTSLLQQSGLELKDQIDIHHILTILKSNTSSFQQHTHHAIILEAIAQILNQGIHHLHPHEFKNQILQKVSLINQNTTIHNNTTSTTTSTATSQHTTNLKSIFQNYNQIQNNLTSSSSSTIVDNEELENIIKSLSTTISCDPILQNGIELWLLNNSSHLQFIYQQLLQQSSTTTTTPTMELEMITNEIKQQIKKSMSWSSQIDNILQHINTIMNSQPSIELQSIQQELINYKQSSSSSSSSSSSPSSSSLSSSTIIYIKKRLLLDSINNKSYKVIMNPLEVVDSLFNYVESSTIPTPTTTTTTIATTAADLQKVEELVDDLINRDDVLLSEESITYSVLNQESGIRFYESNQTHIQQGNGVHITEITTPEADEFCTIRRIEEESFHGTIMEDGDEFELPTQNLLDSSLAKSKLAVRQRGKRRATSPRHDKHAQPLSSLRQEKDASIQELIETEEEFLKDMETVLKIYEMVGDEGEKSVSETRDVIFGSLPKIAEFHRTLLFEALKTNCDNTKLLGRAFTRLEREFDTHAKYIEEESGAERYLAENPTIADFYEDLCGKVDSTKSLIEHLRLPNQRLNDYSVLLQELINYNQDLGEDTLDMEKALELMKILPQKSADEKFLKSIEGYKGSIKGLGRLLSHDWFGITDITGERRERYLFLFKGRILITKVKRITEHRSVFILKDVLRLPDLEISLEDETSFDLYEPSTGGKYHIEHTDPNVKTKWASEVKLHGREPNASRARRQDSVTVDLTAFPKNNTSSSDDDKSADQLLPHKKNGVKETAHPINKTSSNVVLIRRESLKSESDKAPQIIRGLKSTVCEPGDTALFNVEFGSSSPSAVTWLKDNKSLDDKLADRIKMTAMDTNFTMELLNCHDEDSGLYTARCTNEFGSKTSSGMLAVHELSPEERAIRLEENSPGFPVTFKDVDVIEDTVACFMIVSSGNPLPNISIYKDGKPLEYNERVKLESGEEKGHYDLFINHVKTEDAGIYKVIGSNIYGSQEFSAKLGVVDEKDIFHGLDSGAQPLDFTWFRDGKHFTPEERFKVMFRDDEDTLALVFQHVTPEDAGLYTCVASTSSGRISCSAELTVKGAVHQLLKEPSAPTITSKLTRTELNAPGSGMLEIKTEGFPLPTLIWFKDDEEIQIGDKYRILHEDAESTSLIIKNVDISDGGIYKVIATNELGSDESSAPVIIRSSPKFTKEITNMSTLIGSNLSMELEVIGSPIPQLKFYKDGQELRGEGRMCLSSSEDGIHRIELKNVEMKDGGLYSAVAMNSVGQMSSFWSLTINSPPKLQSTFNKQFIKEVGDSLILELETEQPTNAIKWKIDDNEIDIGNPNIKIISDGNKHRLEIKNLDRSSSGKISAILSNDHGTIESDCDLIIKRKPLITSHMKAVTVTSGEDAEFSVKVDSYPKPKVKWFLGDVVLDGKTYDVDGDSYKLNISKVETSGTVRIKVENEFGYDEDSAELTVYKRPEFIQGLKDVTILEEDILDMEIRVSGTPAPNLKMFHNGREVEASARIKITKEATETYHMTFNVVLPSDDGDWSIKASNECGEVESKCTITVEGKPTFEQRLDSTIEVIENEDLELTVTVKGSPTPIMKWTLNNEELKVSKHVQITNEDGKTRDELFSSKLIISQISIEEGGQLQVVAQNKHGSCQSNAQINIIPLSELKGPKLLSPCQNAQITEGEDGELRAIARGSPPPAAEWFKDGVSVGTGIRDGDSYTLPLKSASKSTKGNYELRLTNQYGETKSEAEVDIIPKPCKKPREEIPSFLKKISPTDIYDGMDARFTACVTGYPEPDYEWFKNGEKLIEGENLKFEKEGGCLLRLIITKATKQDAGNYELKLWNPQGQASCQADLKIESLDIPRRSRRDLPDALDKYPKAGGLPDALTNKPIISCMSDRHLTLSWKPSLSSIARYPVTYRVEMSQVNPSNDESDWFVVRSGLRNCICDIRNLDPWLDYKFRVCVENEYGVSEPSPYAITLRSKFDRSIREWSPLATHSIPRHFDFELPPHPGYTHPPLFLLQPYDSQYGLQDSSSKIHWHVYGYPRPVIEFEFNGINITDDIGGGRWAWTFLNNGLISLYVNRVSDGVIGRYRAIARNPYGETSQDMRLCLAQHPHFITRPNETWVFIRRDAHVTACVTGTPLPQIKFYKDWIPVTESSRIKFRVTEHPDGGYLTITMELRESILKDEGLYTFAASNVAGTVHASFNIRVEECEIDYNWGSYGPLRPITTRPRPFLDYYDLGDEVGRGTQGIVYHVVERSTGNNYACKFMTGTGQFRDWMENELNIMDGLSNPYLTRLHEWYSEPNGMRLIMEISSGGDIISSLIGRNDVSEWEISSYIRQLLLGLNYLHENGIAHLGLTPFDILLSRPNGREIQLTDFGLARRIGSRLLPLDYGMPEFIAPEVVLGRGVGYGADIWSVGVITHLLLTGSSLFRGRNDLETLDRIKRGTWDLNERLSNSARDFLSKLLVFEAEGRLDIKSCLDHPWITTRTTETRLIDISRLTGSYYDSLRGWYSNANCRNVYRRRPIGGAYTHPSRMIYPPGDYSPFKETKPVDNVYSRPNLDIEIGQVSSESHYQTGPDTYLLQLRDADFPARLRQYMKVAAGRSPAMAMQLRGAAYDTDRSIIKERRRFTDIMDEEVDDERKIKIKSYGDLRRLRNEVGQHMEVQAEAEALVLSKRSGTLPLFRIRPPPIINCGVGCELKLRVLIDGDPLPTLQWFKNDLVVGESNRLKTIFQDQTHQLVFSKLLPYDFGNYKVVARNPNGVSIARFRLVESEYNEKLPWVQLDYNVEHDPLQSSSSQELAHNETDRIIYVGRFSRILQRSDGNFLRESKGYEKELDLIGGLMDVHLANPISFCHVDNLNLTIHEGGDGASLIRIMSNSKYSEQTLAIIIGQILDGLSYLHWRGYGLFNLEPGNVLLLSNIDNPHVKLIDFSSLQPISRLGSRIEYFTTPEFTAPELLCSEPAYLTTDVWNVGLLLYIFLSGHSPFKGDTDEETKGNVSYVRFRFEYLFKDLTQEVTRFIMLIFKKNPLKRPSIEECLEHRWLLPSEYMTKKREKSSFNPGILKDYSMEYYGTEMEYRSLWE